MIVNKVIMIYDRASITLLEKIMHTIFYVIYTLSILYFVIKSSKNTLELSRKRILNVYKDELHQAKDDEQRIALIKYSRNLYLVNN